MPIYEYRCEPCEHTFETLVRSATDVPHCPECGGIDLEKQFSVPASSQVQGVSASSSNTFPIANNGGCGAGGCGSGMCAM